MGATIAGIEWVFALALAVVHLGVGRFAAVGRPPSRRVVSFASGTAVAYVFVLILPEVNASVLQIVEQSGSIGGFLIGDTEAYVVVLLGFVAFYAVHVYVTSAREEDVETSDLAFGVHVASFSVYNAIIGYLLFHQEESGLLELVFYTVAMGLHFLVIDAGFRRHHGQSYRRVGRWVLSGAILLGAGIGWATEIDETALALLFAFLAGSIVFNVIKEELPDVEWRRFATFLFGAVVYTALLVVT